MTLHGTHVRYVGIYVVFVAGGIWHVLGCFQGPMRLAAGYLIIALASYLAVEWMCSIPAPSRPRAWLWAGCVLVGGFAAEVVGVRTGWPFGKYSYGPVLQPQVGGVPAAIGFAWVLITLSSLLLAAALRNRLPTTLRNTCHLVPLAAVSMLCFDLFMEPAAVALGYWTWAANEIPLSNYLTWLVLGLAFLLLYQGLRLPIPRRTGPGVHAYVAQLAYFILVYFS